MGRQVNFCRVAAVTTNEYARVNLFPVRRKSAKRGAKKKPTSAVQAKLNEERSQNHMADLLHLNFTPDDMEAGLDYSEFTRPETWEDTKRIMRNFLIRLKKAWAKATGRKPAEFKYIVVTERSSTGKWHHHCAFTGGLDALEIQAVWKQGRVETEPLWFDENGVCALAHYITKGRYSYRRWSASRNLLQPAVHTSDSRLTLKELRYINEHPDDIGYIEERFPGWCVAPKGIRTAAIREEEAEMEEGHQAPILPFVSVFLYRKGNPYFTRHPSGEITYHHHRDWRENFAQV